MSKPREKDQDHSSDINLLRKLAEVPGNYQLVLDVDNRVKFITLPFADLLSSTPGKLKAKDVLEVITPVDPECFMSFLKTSWETGGSSHLHSIRTGSDKPLNLHTTSFVSGIDGERELFLTSRVIETEKTATTEIEEIRNRLQSSEKKFRMIFETIPEAIVLSRIEDGTILEANKSFFILTGLEPEEVIGKTSVEIRLFRKIADRKKLVQRIQKGPVIDEILNFQRKNRQNIELSVSAMIISLEGIKHLIWIMRDITAINEQKRMLNESMTNLEASEQKFRAFINHSPDGIVITDESGNIQDWNPSMERFTGIAKDRVIGMDPVSLQLNIQEFSTGRGEPGNEIQEQVEMLLSTTGSVPEPKSFVIELDHPEAGRIEIENTLFVFESGKGRKLGFIARDITKLRQTEEDVLLYKNIFDNSLDGVAILDLKGNYLNLNPAHTRILGYTPEEISGRQPSLFLTEKLFSEIFKVYDFQGIFEGELNARHKSGNPIYLDYILFPVFSNGVHICSVEIIRDISNRKRTERELLDAKRRAEESDQLKTAFLSNMSHEIRTPMNSILGFSTLLEKPDLEYEQRVKYLNFINKNGESLLNLIGDIIDIAKIESNQLRINKESGNLEELLQKINSSMLKLLEREEKSGIQLVTRFEKSADLNIYTDLFRLEQILNNLIYNAIKFTNEGFIEFGYTFSKPEEIVFFVKDTGIGIPPDRMENIFKRFQKLEHSRKKLYGGAGLGLAISSQLVQLLGGRIWVESDVGKGSTFYFSIPFIEGKKIVREEEQEPGSEVHSWPGTTVLIVEDDIYSFELLCEYLEGTQITCIHAWNGKEAVARIVENPEVNLILMDIRMPGMNGFEATRLIKEINFDIPVIAQTAYAMDDDKKQALEAGCNDFLTKPVNSELFFKILKKYL